MLERVNTYLFTKDVEFYQPPWEAMKDTDRVIRERTARIEAIEEFLGVLPNGSFVPLTISQMLFFGSATKKLEYKIMKVRKQSVKVVKSINNLRPWDEAARDTALVRQFVLECLPPFKRYALKINNSLHDEASDERVSWPVSIAAWTFVTGSLLFFIYWIFAWGVYEGEAILRAWGAVFGTGASTDIFLVQITKIIMVHYLPAKAMQSQLLKIRSVLADISMSYINRRDTGSRNAETRSDEKEAISVIQYMSAACRAARAPELNALPAAWLLRQVTLKDFILHNVIDKYRTLH